MRKPMKKLGAVIFWSVVAAAFIGPGTVATAAAAGAAHGWSLLWALVFSTVACFVLQEAAARLAILSGRDLGQALRESSGGGLRGALTLFLVVGSILVGCAAYEAGNLLGAATGFGLILGVPLFVPVLAAAGLAVLLLILGAPGTVARLLSLLVATMGVTFLAIAAAMLFRGGAPGADLAGFVVPTIPAGGALLVLGLVGTTVVPYNLFLGAGLAAGQELGTMRFGLAIAVGLGGLISMAILMVGATLDGPFSYGALAAALTQRTGPWAQQLFGAGLAAAGLTSAVTAPLAAALTARGLFGRRTLSPYHGEAGGDEVREDPRWSPRSWRFRAVWGAVLAVGLAFCFVEERPEAVIIFAQALNGVVLPVAATFLFLAVNDRTLLGSKGLNGPGANLLTGLVVAVTVVLGTVSVLKAGARALDLPAPGAALTFSLAAVVLLLLVPVVGRALARRRGEPA